MPLGKNNCRLLHIFSATFALLDRANSAVQGGAFLDRSCPVQSTGTATVAQSQSPSSLLEEIGTNICAFVWPSKWTWVWQGPPSAVSLSLQEMRLSCHTSHCRRAVEQPGSRSNVKGKPEVPHMSGLVLLHLSISVTPSHRKPCVPQAENS